MKSIKTYVEEIRSAWPEADPEAQAYLDRMYEFRKVDCENAVSAIAKFILNSLDWSDAQSREIKNELNQQIKHYRKTNPIS